MCVIYRPTITSSFQHTTWVRLFKQTSFFHTFTIIATRKKGLSYNTLVPTKRKTNNGKKTEKCVILIQWNIDSGRQSLQCSWTSSPELSADGPQTAGLVIQPFQAVAFIWTVRSKPSVNPSLTAIWKILLLTYLRSIIFRCLRQCDNYNLKSHRQCNDMSRMNLSGYVGHATSFSWMFTIACCVVVGLGLGLDLVSGW